MNDKLKKMVKREDGFLEIQLKRLRDFDDYLFQKMHEDSSCLLCIRDHRSKSRLYYDMKGYLTLLSYLQQHIFEKGEFLAFLIFILEDMVRVNASKPLYLDMEYMFLSSDGRHLKFLVLPLQEDGWLFQKEDARAFVCQLLKEVQTNADYETAGLLVQCLKQQEFTLPLLLQQLHDLQASLRIKKTWWQKLLHKEEEMYYVRDVPNVNVYPSSLPNLDVQEDAAAYVQIEDEKLDEVDSKVVKKKSKTGKAGIKKRKIEKNSEPCIQEARDMQNDHQQAPLKTDAYSSETVVLFAEEKPYLEDQCTHQRILLLKEPFTIGRSPDNDLCLKAPQVSAYHAVIHIAAQQLEDLHSSNGTLVNHERIHQHTLQAGDVIHFANQAFVYHGAVTA